MTIKCNKCGTEIFTNEVYYTLCMHTEVKDSTNNEINILDMEPLGFHCQKCTEKGVAIC